jgi:hypothetical protein
VKEGPHLECSVASPHQRDAAIRSRPNPGLEILWAKPPEYGVDEVLRVLSLLQANWLTSVRVPVGLQLIELVDGGYRLSGGIEQERGPHRVTSLSV